MENFIAWNPTKLIFGKDVVNSLPKYLNTWGSRVLLIYGKDSIKKNGIYNQVTTILSQSGKKVTEFSGIKSNPLSTDAQKASDLAHRENIDLIIAVGGGSVIDTAKLVSLCAPSRSNVWEVMTYNEKPKKSIPLISILTLAATGTEMNSFAVLQNPSTGEKLGFGSLLIYPTLSFLDPSYTLSVPKDYTAWGIADIFAHCMEAFFGEGDATLSDKLVFGILQEVIEYGPQLMNNLNDYRLREKILWASTCGLNGITLHGRKSGDWGVHDIGHTLSYLYDVPHGASLTIAYMAWLKHMESRIADRLLILGQNVFHVNSTQETVESIKQFFTLLHCPLSLEQMNISFNKQEIKDLLINNEVSGYHYLLDEMDLKKIVDLM